MDMGMGNGGSALDFATYINSALRNRDGNGAFGDEGGLLWFFLLILLWGGNGFGRNGMAAQGTNDLLTKDLVDSAIQKARADGLSDTVVLEAINGNKEALSTLATTLNSDIGRVQDTLGALNTAILQVGNQVGMSGQQIINAIQSSNSTIQAAMQSCCCDLKEAIAGTNQLVTQLNYDNRLQTMQQTQDLSATIRNGIAALEGKMDVQNATMAAGFQGIKDYLCEEKIATLQHQVTQLENAANNNAQTAALNAYVNAATAPIQSQVTQILSRIPPQPVPTYPAQGNTWGYVPTNGCCNS